jgi:hypothetical protein
MVAQFFKGYASPEFTRPREVATVPTFLTGFSRMLTSCIDLEKTLYYNIFFQWINWNQDENQSIFSEIEFLWTKDVHRRKSHAFWDVAPIRRSWKDLRRHRMTSIISYNIKKKGVRRVLFNDTGSIFLLLMLTWLYLITGDPRHWSRDRIRWSNGHVLTSWRQILRVWRY